MNFWSGPRRYAAHLRSGIRGDDVGDGGAEVEVAVGGHIGLSVDGQVHRAAELKVTGAGDNLRLAVFVHADVDGAVAPHPRGAVDKHINGTLGGRNRYPVSLEAHPDGSRPHARSVGPRGGELTKVPEQGRDAGKFGELNLCLPQGGGGCGMGACLFPLLQQ